jgi:hypothetical protein
MRVAISDESGTQQGNRCYGIGALVVPVERHAECEGLVKAIFDRRGVSHELKWSLTPSRKSIEAACEATEAVLRNGARFYAIIVEKARFNNLRLKGKEEAFYQTYQFLAERIAMSGDDDFELLMDERSDSYNKRPQVVRIITNYQLRKREQQVALVDVRMIDSRTSVLLQIVDLLTGAITADRHSWLGGERTLQPGRWSRSVVSRLY